MAVLLEMRHRAFGRIDRDMGEIGAAQPFDLRVEIGEIAALEQGVVRKVDARRHILRHEGDLLGLGKEIVDHAIEHQPADDADRHQLLGDDLGGVEHVEVKAVGEIIIEQLHAQLPFGEVAAIDRVPQVAAVEVGSAPLILTASFQTTDCSPCLGFQWNLTKVDLPAASTRRKVWTPKPSMVRKERGIARSDMTHMIMWKLSGVRLMKSQKLSWAEAACGNSRSGSGFTE